jgi:hypothetical protein
MLIALITFCTSCRSLDIVAPILIRKNKVVKLKIGNYFYRQYKIEATGQIAASITGDIDM